MARHRDEDSGRFQAAHGPQDVLEAMTPGEPYSGKELDDKLDDIPNSTVYHYLDLLAEREAVRKKKPGARSAIWMRDE